MYYLKTFTTMACLLLLFSLSCNKGPDAQPGVKEAPPWEKRGEAKETVKDSPETGANGCFLILSDAPKFYETPGGTVITKANIKKLYECITCDDLPQKGEAEYTWAWQVYDYVKYYRITISLSELCTCYVWVQAGEGAFLTFAQFNEYTKTLATVDKGIVDAIASSKVEPLNFGSAKKIFMGKDKSGASFYLISIMDRIFPKRWKKRADFSGYHQFVILEKNGAYTLVSPDLRISTFDPDLKVPDNNTDLEESGVASIKYADLDGDGIPEIVTFLPTIGATPGSEFYGYVNGMYTVLGQCHEGEGCYYTIDGKFVVRHFWGDGEEKDENGNNIKVKKEERFSYKAGKLTLVPEQK